MASLRQIAFIDYPNVVFPLLSTAFAVPALSPTPSFVPLILLVTTLLLYTRMIIPRPHAPRTIIITWFCISLASSLSQLLPSLNALSSTFGSLVALWAISSASSGVALIVIFFDRMSLHMTTPWSKITFFPAIWATVWQGIAHASPIGHLQTWSPVAGIAAYDWMRPLFGTWAINWVVGAYAVVGAEVVGAWFIGPDEVEDTDVPLLIDNVPLDVVPESPAAIASRGSRHTLFLGATLLALATPSFFLQARPLRPFDASTTPLSVGCILPQPPGPNDHRTTLERFIYESQQHNDVKVLLWPEGAVRFDNPTQRAEVLKEVQTRVRGPLVGVAFEEHVPRHDPDWQHARPSQWRNGLALVGPDGVVAEYYKRNLVPIAESYSLASSHLPPTIYTLQLPNPKGRSPTDWAPDAPHTRPVSLTSSICLDFATPSPFAALDARPALVLAPAHTWHPAVGRAVWEQARARAEELGSAVLFCDGGDGSVSGIAGHGVREVMQEGPGSWTRTIGVPWPAQERRTLYAWGGDWMVFSVVWSLLGVGWAVESAARLIALRKEEEGEEATPGLPRWLTSTLARLRMAIPTRVQRRPRGEGEEQPLLF